MDAIVYARSTNGSQCSLDVQEDVLGTFCVSAGYKPIASYCDPNCSSRKLNGRQLMTAVEHCRQIKGVFLAYSPCRVSRTENLRGFVEGMLKAGGCTIHYAFNQLTKPEWQRVAHAEMGQRGLAVRQPKFGFELFGPLVVRNEYEQSLVLEIKELAKTTSLRGICRMLEARKIPTKNGGETWSPSTIKKIIES